jgi:hypothetical protein
MSPGWGHQPAPAELGVRWGTLQRSRPRTRGARCNVLSIITAEGELKCSLENANIDGKRYVAEVKRSGDIRQEQLFFKTEIPTGRTMNDANALLEKIKSKRLEVADYLKKSEPRQSRLITTSIVAGALAAALTAGPGVGGSGFIEAAKGVVSFGIPVWQVLCLLATLLSMAAVITNGLLKARDPTFKIAQVRGCDAKLEGLETMLELNQIDLQQAASLYTQYLTEISHVR